MTGVCGRTKRDGSEEDCQLPAGWGTDHPGEGACKHHGGAGGAPTGEENGNYKHGAFSEHLRSDLTDSELDAIDEMVDAYENPEKARELIAEQAAEAWLKYKRSADTRFLREYRQLAETFNLAPNEDMKEVELSGKGGGPVEIVREVVETDEHESD
jgi:hypothetical protein